MKITKIEDIDLSQYKLADFPWAMEHEETHEKVMKMAEAEVLDEYDFTCRIALIPKDKKLTDCWWDDWNDKPASCNASWFYTYPEGTIFLEWVLWKELKLITK